MKWFKKLKKKFSRKCKEYVNEIKSIFMTCYTPFAMMIMGLGMGTTPLVYVVLYTPLTLIAFVSMTGVAILWSAYYTGVFVIICSLRLIAEPFLYFKKK
jgi:hypothetical protein